MAKPIIGKITRGVVFLLPVAARAGEGVEDGFPWTAFVAAVLPAVCFIAAVCWVFCDQTEKRPWRQKRVQQVKETASSPEHNGNEPDNQGP